MIEVKKEINLSFSSFSNCKDLYGHTYRILIVANSVFSTIETPKNTFENFENFIFDTIINKLNNAYIYNKNSSNSCELEVAKILKSNNSKIFEVNFEVIPSNLIKYIFKTLNFSCVMENKDFRIFSLELFTSQYDSIVVKDDN